MRVTTRESTYKEIQKKAQY